VWHLADRWHLRAPEALATGETTRPAPVTITVSSAMIVRRYDFNMALASEPADVDANPAAKASYEC